MDRYYSDLPYHAQCIGVPGERWCGELAVPGSAYCPNCAAAIAELHARIEQAAPVFDLAYVQHHYAVRTAILLSRPRVCSSCGDPSPTAICAACRESGELLSAA